LGKEASCARLVRITMKDGSVEEFLVESVKTLTFQANPNDSSNIYDDDEEEDPERSDEPDRTPEQQSSGSVTPSSSSVEPSSSSETPSAIPNDITYAGTRLGWNSRNQTLSIFSRQGGEAWFTVLDVQGVVIGKGNLYVSWGVTSISLDYLDLPKGNFVVKFEIGNTKLQQTIAVTGK
jgi:hypothetical protein